MAFENWSPTFHAFAPNLTPEIFIFIKLCVFTFNIYLTITYETLILTSIIIYWIESLIIISTNIYKLWIILIVKLMLHDKLHTNN